MVILRLLLLLLPFSALEVQVTPAPQAAPPLMGSPAADETLSIETASMAQCLTEKGAKMYGAFWCPHCADQKKLFGENFQFITYIECDPRGEDAQTELCAQNNITSYPTWIFADGERSVGTQPPEILAQKAGCL